ncbi:efflux RND transporter periplasmic adaptor subunit [Mycobacterium sp. KBS0706]|uniref:efflux RND transporter periplasmic adaptor subunit n=1 Tax=Mycobacterium sp. KBS0706 TaxID=2578109 RepID=UPI00163D8E1D|nr:efflux RND transporter periplasmic adaptor subunit [Mycobacterium sp. KBS0706]
MRRKLLLAAVGVVAGLSGSLFVLGSDIFDPVSSAAPIPVVPPVPVAEATVTKQDVPIELDGLGRVQAFNTVTVRTQVEGQIQQIAYDQGQTVKKGDLLVTIDPRIYQAKLEQDQAALARDQAHLANAQANLGRYKPLERSGYATDQQVDTQQAMIDQLQASIKGDQAVIDQDQVELGYTKITAPITGVTGFRLVDEGNVVHPTDANGLVTIAQIQPIAVLFTLPQAALPDIQRQMAGAGTAGLTVEAWSQDGTGKLDTGTLETLDNTVDAASGTITLRADFPNPQKMLWPGEFVQARLVLRVQHDGLTVPAAVVQRGPDGAFAWVVRPDGTVVPQPIQVAQMVRGTALVTSGLAAGQTVVSDGQYGLQRGDTVTARGPADAADAPLMNSQTDTLGIQP